VLRNPRLACLPVGRVGGVKGYNMNDMTMPGSPFDILRAVSFVERPRPVGGELHKLSGRAALSALLGRRSDGE